MTTVSTDVVSFDALRDLQLLDSGEVDALPWSAVPGCDGVSEKVLWRLGGFTQALIRYEPGAVTAGDPHLAAHHHIWVQQGELTFAGRRLAAGSYAHVPPGVRHAAEDVGPLGCTLVQMHRPHPPRESAALVEVTRTAAAQRPAPTRRAESRPSPHLPARLRMGPDETSAAAAHVDGVWWPRSSDLVAELPALLAALPSADGHPRGVMFNLDAWEQAPAKVTIDGTVVKLGGYRMLSPELVQLTATRTSKALVLRVLAPSTDPTVAAEHLTGTSLHDETAPPVPSAAAHQTEGTA